MFKTEAPAKSICHFFTWLADTMTIVKNAKWGCYWPDSTVGIDWWWRERARKEERKSKTVTHTFPQPPDFSTLFPAVTRCPWKPSLKMSLAAPIFYEVSARGRKGTDLRQCGWFSCCHSTGEKVLGGRVRMWPSAIITALGDLHTGRWVLVGIDTRSVMCSWMQIFQAAQESQHLPPAVWAVGPPHAANKSLYCCTASPLPLQLHLPQIQQFF